jgi:hypothetical protein
MKLSVMVSSNIETEENEDLEHWQRTDERSHVRFGVTTRWERRVPDGSAPDPEQLRNDIRSRYRGGR